MKKLNIHFFGASGTVTGSKYYLETEEVKIMVDCGLFQGLKDLREHNWERLPVDVSEMDYVLLTHGHLDHCGYIPLLVRHGFRGKILGTAPTLEIARIILEDSAKIQEEEAKRANEGHYSKHDPALPLYTEEDAAFALKFFEQIEEGKAVVLSDNCSATFLYNGHIIGSTYIEMDLYGKRLVFSGDVGRQQDELLNPPKQPEWADYLFVESTYGDRLHPEEDVEHILTELVKETLQKKGTLIIPSFAVERLQSLMYQLWKLYRMNRIPNIPIFVDSPMGNNVLEVFEEFPSWHKLTLEEYHNMCNHISIVSSYAETWETIDDPRPKIVIAGSGMVTGGRVLTYIKQLGDLESTSILLVGFQAEETRGRKLLEGATELKIYGKYISIKAKVHHLESLSAHADQAELLTWMGSIKNVPEKVFLVHGERSAMDVYRERIHEKFGWNCHIPEMYEVVEIPL
ncbi:MBL fold metallo-hydrolase RNA specificity domain-containing protein [Flagellimonas oceanensis]|uniref:MBL fold metallo-hydrolase RNA specificity domain-containing protein n=1 Tax=Flagellimonas oceanensis TaxID=2499163 RepID=UPI000F8C4653|nr:MBL fold metallo-hydrolase [Allomuricauda oceanensis]|tara:strand:- start:19123 stop:20493 length:1371 start_codon:yes stop_codon:yes gene_type:complete